MSHFLTAAINFSCFSSNEIHLLCFLSLTLNQTSLLLSYWKHRPLLQGILPIWSNQAIPATSSDVKICIDKQIFSASRNAEFLNLQTVINIGELHF